MQKKMLCDLHWHLRRGGREAREGPSKLGPRGGHKARRGALMTTQVFLEFALRLRPRVLSNFYLGPPPAVEEDSSQGGSDLQEQGGLDLRGRAGAPG